MGGWEEGEKDGWRMGMGCREGEEKDGEKGEVDINKERGKE